MCTRWIIGSKHNYSNKQILPPHHEHNIALEHNTTKVSHIDSPWNLLNSSGSWSRSRTHLSRRLRKLWVMLWWLIWLYNVCARHNCTGRRYAPDWDSSLWWIVCTHSIAQHSAAPQPYPTIQKFYSRMPKNIF